MVKVRGVTTDWSDYSWLMRKRATVSKMVNGEVQGHVEK